MTRLTHAKNTPVFDSFYDCCFLVPLIISLLRFYPWIIFSLFQFFTLKFWHKDFQLSVGLDHNTWQPVAMHDLSLVSFRAVD